MPKPVNLSGSYLGAAIREIRKRRGVSQGELADLLGGSRNTVSNWERGVHEPPASAVEAVAKALRVSAIDIESLAMSLLTAAASDRERGALPERGHLAYSHGHPESPRGVAERRVSPRIPPRAYQLVFEHCQTLERASVPEDIIDEARRLMSGETFNTLNKGMADTRDEAGWVKDVQAAWAFIRDSLIAQGYDL